jgi:hypothetical protein
VWTVVEEPRHSPTRGHVLTQRFVCIGWTSRVSRACACALSAVPCRVPCLPYTIYDTLLYIYNCVDHIHILSQTQSLSTHLVHTHETSHTSHRPGTRRTQTLVTGEARTRHSLFALAPVLHLLHGIHTHTPYTRTHLNTRPTPPQPACTCVLYGPKTRGTTPQSAHHYTR